MQSLIDISQVIGTVQIDGKPFEVCAEAKAMFQRGRDELSVQLHSYLQPEEQTHLMEKLVPAWLPAANTVTEHVPHEEASDVAKDIFASWCHKVEAALSQQTAR